VALPGSEEEKEKELVRRAQQDDQEAWEEIYRMHGPYLYKLILWTVTQIPLAEDLTQDVFVRAWKSIGGFRGESRLRSWLCTIAVNAMKSHFQKAKRVPIDQSTNQEEITDDRGQAESIEQSIIARQGMARRQSALQKAIRSLTYSERIAFTLHHLNKLSYEEAAVLRDVTPVTIRVQCFRAIIKIRKELARWPALK
jgi:RNA polymerase sigma-70 factor (ECF subfamily)